MAKKRTLNSKHGVIRIADEVVAITSALASVEVEGVESLSGGIAGGISEAVGRKNLARGVKVEVGEEEAVVDLQLIVKYGESLQEVAKKVQQNVKKVVEDMTGLKVVRVDVYIPGVSFSQETVEAEQGLK